MRLINVDTLELEEFFDEDIPEYAILSHTWSKEEVTFQELNWLHEYEKNRTAYASLETLVAQIGQNFAGKAAALRQKSGFEKISQSALLAKHRGLQFVWVDTCCIDKTSSTELSEAINSMFAWYKRSNVCLAFLSDVSWPTGDGTLAGKITVSGFEKSRWFTRGWTLQELLAPKNLLFYDRDWGLVGDKDKLVGALETATGIHYKHLVDSSAMRASSVAQKMSWASKRRTSRKEDGAYCLLGLFGIHMPLLYGEGESAFIRLQEEIIKKGTDHSFLVWGIGQPMGPETSILAPSAAFLANAGTIEIRKQKSLASSVLQLSNRGLEVTLDLFQLPQMVKNGYFRLKVLYAVPRVSGPLLQSVCFPVFAVGYEDTIEMFRGPSRPLLIERSTTNSRLPERSRPRKTIIVDNTRDNWGSHFRFFTELPPLGSVELLETMPPALEAKFTGEHFTLTLPSIYSPKMLFLRFADHQEGSTRQFVVAIKMPPEEDALYKSIVIEWPRRTRQLDGGGIDRGGDNATMKVVKTPSLVDEFACISKPEDLDRFFEAPEFLVGNKTLSIKVTSQKYENLVTGEWSLDDDRSALSAAKDETPTSSGKNGIWGMMIPRSMRKDK